MHTCIPHRRNAYIAVPDLHRGASVDHKKDVTVASSQFQGRLSDADVRFTAVKDHLAAIKTAEVGIDLLGQHGKLLLLGEDLYTREVRVLHLATYRAKVDLSC